MERSFCVTSQWRSNTLGKTTRGHGPINRNGCLFRVPVKFRYRAKSIKHFVRARLNHLRRDLDFISWFSRRPVANRTISSRMVRQADSSQIFCNFWKRIEIFGRRFGNKLKPLEGKGRKGKWGRTRVKAKGAAAGWRPCSFNARCRSRRPRKKQELDYTLILLAIINRTATYLSSKQVGRRPVLNTPGRERPAREFFSAKVARNPLISPRIAEIFCNFLQRMEIFGRLLGKKLKPLEGKGRKGKSHDWARSPIGRPTF